MQRNSIINAQHSVYHAVNAAMVQAYWGIGEQIYKACGENDRAEYGKNLLKFLSERLTFEFGKGFDEFQFKKNASVLYGISNSGLTETRIELDTL